MNHIDLQQLLDRELKQLPRLKAPDTLLPRVLALTVHEQPADSRGAWLAWPRAWQLVSAAAAVAFIAGAWMLMQIVQPGDLLWSTAGETPSRVAGFGQSAGNAATLVRVFWEVLLQPVAIYVSALAISFALACAVLWTAVERLALGGASQQ
jgi:hypothetical protein